MDFRAAALQICTNSAQWTVATAFITDKEQRKSGLIIFMRGDVASRKFHCRIKLPKKDRYISKWPHDRSEACGLNRLIQSQRSGAYS